MGFVEANSRVSFSRPGEMIRIPSADHAILRKLLTINLSYEILSLYQGQGNTGLAINTANKSGYQYGISFVKPERPFNSAELSFHFQKHMLVYGDINFDIGIHDIALMVGDYSSTKLDTRNISFFAVLSSDKLTFWGENRSDEDYFSISTHLGIGSGKIVQDSQLGEPSSEQKIGAFLGFQFKIPFSNENGGVTLLTEFDGMGLNIGLQISMLKLYQINLGITRFDNFGNFSTEDKIDDYAKLRGDAPTIVLGLTINVPRLYGNKGRNISRYSINRGIYSKTDSSILFYNPICTEVVETLRDSIHIGNNLIENLEDHNIMLLHQEAVLLDSMHNNLFQKNLSQSKQNKAMRHLSRSLRFFYDERYKDALSEVNTAIEVNPNFAIAYGRRGSIYYKLGDIRKATLNWNAALQLDPEFTEIYDMLKASDENRLESVEISKKLGEN